MAKSIRIRREIIIGIIVFIIVAFFLWGISYLKSEAFFSKRIEYIAVYDRVSGLNVDNPVMINGIRIGKVKEMGFLPNNPKKVYIKVILQKKVNIPENSTMMVVSSDLLGAKAVEIQLGDSKSFAKTGDTLSSGVSKSLKEEVNMQILPLKIKAEELLSSFDTLLGSIQSIFNAKTIENLNKSFESMKYSVQNIETSTYNIDTLIGKEKSRAIKIIENIESITNNFKANNEKLSNIINNFSTISDSLAKVNIIKTIKDADKAINDLAVISQKINQGKGSLGLLINNDSLYNNLQASSDELKKLLEDMRLNPQRYVNFSIFGKKTPPYKPPAKNKE